MKTIETGGNTAAHREWRRALLRSVLVLGGALVTGGCGREPPFPLRIGTNVWPGYEPLYLARDLELYSRDSVTLVEYGSASQVLRALEFGALDAGALTLDEALLLQSAGVDVRVALVLDCPTGGGALVAVPVIPDLGALRGRRVGAESTAVGAYMLARALEHAGLTVADIDLVPVELSEHEAAFRAETVDALVTFDPVRERLLSAGARLLFDSTQIPGEVIDVIVVRAELLTAHRRQIAQALRGWFAALDYIAEHPRAAAARMNGRLLLGDDGVLAALRRITLVDAPANRRILVAESKRFLAPAERLADVMMRHALAPARPVPARLLDRTLLAKLHP